jgi:hypothetical protein
VVWNLVFPKGSDRNHNFDLRKSYSSQSPSIAQDDTKSKGNVVYLNFTLDVAHNLLSFIQGNQIFALTFPIKRFT